MTTPVKFVHLNLHTEFSLVDGLIKVKSLMPDLLAKGMPSVAITDHNNLFALVKFYKAAQQAGIKPIVGTDLWIHNSQDHHKPYRLILLCQNGVGYQNLTRLISRSYLETPAHETLRCIKKSWLKESTQGLIALSGEDGEIGQALLNNQIETAENLLQEWQSWFPNRFYLELQRIGRPQESDYIQAAVTLASRTQTPIVATNAVRFLRTTDFEAHEARVCIHSGYVLEDQRRPRNYTEQQYLRSADEMAALFSDLPSALTNSVEIAKRCTLFLEFGKTFLPNFSVPSGLSLDAFFEQSTKTGLSQRLNEAPTYQKNTIPMEQYEKRLQMEMSVIQSMGFTSYFLIVADFIHWAKSQGIFVGPGRGSGAGSLVAYALGITELDPIIHDLLFERFLNPERISMPDFDIDFCMEGRDRVIEYVAQKYGRDSVAQIITFGTMAARAVIRDVGRVLGHPYGFVDKIAKLIPFELGMTLKKALVDEPLFKQRYEQEDEVKTLIELGMALEGVPRNAGKHAGGVVIAPSVLTDFTPLYCEPGGENRVTQFDKDDVEAVGLVKFDFLGLRTLTIMDWALQTINTTRQAQGLPPIEINQIPLDDPATYRLLQSGNTTAVFQLESRGLKELMRRLVPDRFDEIVALVALYRPGPLGSGMVDDFLNCKHGKASIAYPHPLLEPILRNTYGVILYQEQVMQIAQVLAGYTLGSADILRRAMGKKKADEMARQRAIFVSGAEKNGVTAPVANQIFNLMEKFADYGFNKSHSAVYALLSYQTAWLKTHYPAQFMAAVLSSDMDHTDKVVKMLQDCASLNLTILPPNINQSHYRFTVSESGCLIYGLGAIKGIGGAALDSILNARTERGEFHDLFSLCRAVDTRKVNRKVLEALIRSGACDSFGQERSILMASLSHALQAAEQYHRVRHKKQMDFFADSESEADFHDQRSVLYQNSDPFSDTQRLQGEKETLGWYISGHPIAQYQKELDQFIRYKISELRPTPRDQTVMIAGYIMATRNIQTKSGNRMAALTLEDQFGRIDALVFSPLYDECRQWLVKDQLVIMEAEVLADDYTESYKLKPRQLWDLSKAREKFLRQIEFTVIPNQLNEKLTTDLYHILQPFLGGNCTLRLRYEHPQVSAHFIFGEKWCIVPHSTLLEQLQMLFNFNKLEFFY